MPFVVNKKNNDTVNTELNVEYKAKPLWVSSPIYDSISKIRDETGVNISSIVESLILQGLKCREVSEKYNMQCKLCVLCVRDKSTDSAVSESDK